MRDAGDPLAEVRDDIDVQVLPIFLEEAQELFPRASGHVTSWRHDANNPAHSDDLKRTLHTLKGSARMAGAMASFQNGSTRATVSFRHSLRGTWPGKSPA